MIQNVYTQFSFGSSMNTSSLKIKSEKAKPITRHNCYRTKNIVTYNQNHKHMLENCSNRKKK